MNLPFKRVFSLFAIPALAGLLAWRVRGMQRETPFAELRQQLAQDLATLRILDEE